MVSALDTLAAELAVRRDPPMRPRMRNACTLTWMPTLRSTAVLWRCWIRTAR